jgi:hypothetical protein
MNVINLGWCVGKLDLVRGRLIIVSPSSAEDGQYSPAESVLVHGETALIALRDALNAAYPPKKEHSEAWNNAPRAKTESA